MIVESAAENASGGNGTREGKESTKAPGAVEGDKSTVGDDVKDAAKTKEKKVGKTASIPKGSSVTNKQSTKIVSKSATSSTATGGSVTASERTAVVESSTLTVSKASGGSTTASKTVTFISKDRKAISISSISQNQAKVTSDTKITEKHTTITKTRAVSASSIPSREGSGKKKTAPVKGADTSTRKVQAEPAASKTSVKKEVASGKVAVSKHTKKEDDAKPATESAKKSMTTASKPKDKKPDTKNASSTWDTKKPLPSKAAPRSSLSTKAASTKPAQAKVTSAKQETNKSAGIKSTESNPLPAGPPSSPALPAPGDTNKPTAEVTPIVKESDVEVQLPKPEDEIKKEEVLDGQDNEEVNPEEKIRNNIMKCGSCMII